MQTPPAKKIAAAVVGVADEQALDELRRRAKIASWSGYDTTLKTWAIEIGDYRDGLITLLQPSEEMQQLVLNALGLGDLESELYADAIQARLDEAVA